jgi:hypothetical protein
MKILYWITKGRNHGQGKLLMVVRIVSEVMAILMINNGE